MTLRELAGRSELSESFISQIERGRSAPSVASLYRIANALGVPLADLFAAEEPEPRDPVLHESDRLHLTWGKGARKTLITRRADSDVDVFVAVFPPGSSTGDEAYQHGDSSEVILVMSGTVELKLGDSSHTLVTGDSIEYRSSVLHKVTNSSSLDAEVLWVVSPPTRGAVGSDDAPLTGLPT